MRGLRGLTADEREVLNRAMKTGLATRLKLGVVDGLTGTPELAHTLILHGATPGNDFLDRVDMVMTWRIARMDGYKAADGQTKPLESWMVELMEGAADQHPQLDWFALSKSHIKNDRGIRLFNLNYHFQNTLRQVMDRRREAGIPVGPFNASREDLDFLLDKALTPYNTPTFVHFTNADRDHWIEGLLCLGADPDRRTERTDYEPPLCALARAMRARLGWVDLLLAHGARVDEQVIHDVAFVLHDRQHHLRANREEIISTCGRILDTFQGQLDLDGTAPSNEYLKPTLRHVLDTHYPEISELVQWRGQATRLERETPEAEDVRAAPSRRL